MKIEEFNILVKGLKAVYTYERFLPDADSIKIWFNLLKDLDYGVLSTAIQKYMMVETKPPTIADLRRYSAECQNVSVGDWSEEWERALKAIHYYGSYRENEALESLPELTRETVKRVGYKTICMSENVSIERANFRQIYEILKDRKSQDMQISGRVKEMIGTLQGVKGIEVKNE